MPTASQDTHDLVARIEQRTNRILLASGTAFLAWQASYFTLFHHEPPLRNVDIVFRFGFLLWCAALVMLVATGGGLFRGPQVREILDDERARAQRATAYRNAFWVMMLLSVVAYVAAPFAAMDAAVLAHVVLSAGVLVAVGTLAYLNRH